MKTPRLMIALCLASVPLPASGQTAGKYSVFLPLIIQDSDPFEGIDGLKKGDCRTFNANEVEIAKKIFQDPLQRRQVITCNRILNDFARRKAEDMARRSYFSHTDPDGFGPNHHVREMGYPLPGFYGDAPDDNNIESLAAGYATVDKTLAAWISSSSHRAHVMGENSFYRAQQEFGIGYFHDPNSIFKHYWVFISAYQE